MNTATLPFRTGPTLDEVQSSWIEAICAEREDGVKSTVLEACTGSGKTVLAAKLIKHGRAAWDGRFLFVVDEINLVEQTEDKFARWGLTVSVEQADRRARLGLYLPGHDRPDVVVATRQTLTDSRLRRAFRQKEFTDVFVDECFPAGTLVDGRPIEDIKEGDLVRSFNHLTHEIEFKRVLCKSVRKAVAMRRVVLSDGTSVVCSSNHPFFVWNGDISDSDSYVEAKNLTPGTLLFRPEHPDSTRTHHEQAASGQGFLRDLRDRVQSGDIPDGSSHVLLGGLQGRASSPGQGGVLQSHAGQQPDGHPGGQGAGDRIAPQDGLEAEDSRRQWSRADRPPEDAGRRPGLADGGRRQDRVSAQRGESLPALLQAGHRQSGVEDRDRGGRGDAPQPQDQGEGSEEGRLPSFPRVVRVEVLQFGSDGRFGGVCPDGHVYNIEVEDNNNYFVDGLLVHNCHLGLKGKQLKAIREYLQPEFVVGLSATPWFGSGERIVPKFFDTTATTYPLEQAISDGNLVPVRLIERECPVDLREVDIVATANGRDFHAGQLEDRINAGVGAIANIARSEIERYGLRRCLHFTPSVKSAINLAKAYTQLGFASRAIYGDCPDRDDIFRDYHEGRIRVLTGCSMFTKGFDDPPTDGLVMGRPTMSLALAYQMLGRGTRISPDTGKTCCRVVGFHWKSRAKGPVSTLDLFMQDLDEATKKLARQLVRLGRDVDVMKAKEEARKAREHEQEVERKKGLRREAHRLAVRRREVAGRRREFDRFGGKDAVLQTIAALPERPGMATKTQIARLAELDYDLGRAATLTEAQARDAIHLWDGRRDAGMSTFKQCSYLMRLGVSFGDALSCTGREASELIDRIKSRHVAGAS